MWFPAGLYTTFIDYLQFIMKLNHLIGLLIKCSWTHRHTIDNLKSHAYKFHGIIIPGLNRNVRRAQQLLLRTKHQPIESHAHSNSTYVNNHWFHSQAKNNKLRIKKVLVVTKITRYEFEKIRHPGLNEVDLEEKIRCRGTDFDALMHYHHLHKTTEKNVVDCFRQLGVEVKVVNRLTINRDLLHWTDLLVPVGGDGTFLLAASRASPLFIDNSVPIVGFNSDPKRSEGRLMLPKQYTTDVNNAVKKLLTGDFAWMHRSRIRITLLGVNGKAPVPIDLHEYNTQPVEHKEVIISEPSLLDHINGSSNGNGKRRKLTKRMLPYLALNEVRTETENFREHSINSPTTRPMCISVPRWRAWTSSLLINICSLSSYHHLPSLLFPSSE